MFAGCGIPSRVSIASHEGRAGEGVFVVDAETRHASPEDAFTRVTRIAREHGTPLIYHKTDSTLRGNIAAEISALLALHPEAPVLYVPAYPKMGRTVRAGHLFVHGTAVEESAFARDPLNPVVEGSISRLLARHIPAPIRTIRPTELELVQPGSVWICDGETDRDIAQAARFAAEWRGPLLVSGPAALAGELARRLEYPRREAPARPRVARCLVVNGSMHEVSLRQVETAIRCGWPLATPGSLAAAMEAAGWVVLDAQVGETGATRARRTGEIVRRLLNAAAVEGVAVFGGDTAFGILSALGCPPLTPVGEILPGVPLSFTDHAGRRTWWITKAGGFGPDGILCDIRSLLDETARP